LSIVDFTEESKDPKVKADVVVFGQSVKPSSDEDHVLDYNECDVCNVSKFNPNLLLFKSAAAGNIPVMLLAKCNKANCNWNNEDENGQTALMRAAINGSVSACEFLLMNGAKIDEQDWQGRTVLHYAAMYNQTGITCQLLRKRINLDIADEDGKRALDIAVDKAYADIVTLIRLKRMNDEMKDDNNSSAQANAMVEDVFRDFSSRASTSSSGGGGLRSPSLPDQDETFNIVGGTLQCRKNNNSNHLHPNESSV